jgi:hypothetical protein
VWKYGGKIAKEYDKDVKGYINILNTAGVSKMQIPTSDKQSLGIVQSYIVFQIYLFSPKGFNIEITISDTSKTKRRLIFSTSGRDIVINPLHCRIPILNIPIGAWINLSIDVLSFVSECFKNQTFRSIDFISITASCKIRRIFSMRNSLVETTRNTNDDFVLEYADILPKNLALPGNVSFENININIEKLKSQINELGSGQIIHESGHGSDNPNKMFLSPQNKMLSGDNFGKNSNLSKAGLPANKNNTGKNLILVQNIVHKKQLNLPGLGVNSNKTTPNKRAKSIAHTKPAKNNNLELDNQQDFIEEGGSNNNYNNYNYKMRYESKSPNKDKDKENHKEQEKEDQILVENKNSNKFISKNKKKSSGLPGSLTKDLKKVNNILNKHKNNFLSNNQNEKGRQNINIKNKIKAPVQENALLQSQNSNANTKKADPILLNTLNYKNLEKWDNSKDNYEDSIEEIYECLDRNSPKKDTKYFI